MRNSETAEIGDQSVGNADRLRLAAVRQEEGEFLAADPCSEVTCAARSACHQRRHAPERFVAFKMAVVVVELLEAVDAEQQQRQRLALARAAFALLLDAFLEGAPVAETGQPVTKRELREAGIGCIQLGIAGRKGLAHRVESLSQLPELGDKASDVDACEFAGGDPAGG